MHSIIFISKQNQEEYEMQKKPFWEQLYADMEVSTFSKGPTVDVNEFSAMPDNAPYTHSLFDVGELPEKYKDWEIIHHHEGTFRDSHPGDIHHEHAFERIIAKRIG